MPVDVASYLGNFLQLLSLQSLNDSPEKLLLLMMVVPERTERGGKEREEAHEHLVSTYYVCYSICGLLGYSFHMLFQLVFMGTLKSKV